MSTIRASIRDQVALCRFVSERDTRLALGDATSEALGSFRKIQWKHRREAEWIAPLDATKKRDAYPDETTATEANSESSVQEQEMHINTTGQEETDSDAHRDEEHPVLRFDEFIDEFVESDVDVASVQHFEGKPTDPLGVISVPSKREGNSLTLCCHDGVQQLVVFGGCVLKDMTYLLPVAMAVDSQKLERVRYAFSNGVYSYDIDSRLWNLHLCSGREPKQRSDHTANFVEPHYLFVFGGRGRNGQIFDDFLVLSLNTWHWSELETRTRPSERYWHDICVTDNRFYLFGGKSDVQIHSDLQEINALRLLHLLSVREAADQERKVSGEATFDGKVPIPIPLPWVVPNTVGKPPSARFGLRMVRIDQDRVAFVGGWRAAKRHAKPHHMQHHSQSSRSMDVYVLDTMTMVWTKPRLSSHICAVSAPPERFNFECFTAFNSIVVMGGFTYANDGTTDSYRVRDDGNTIYKLDVHRMIWRRQVLSETKTAAVAAHAHHSSNAVLFTSATSKSPQERTTAYTCSAPAAHVLLDVAAITVQPKISPGRPNDQ